MPELPEVERARRLVEDSCAGRQIVACEALEDLKVLQNGLSSAGFQAALVGRRLDACHRRGKLFWWELDGGAVPSPLFHFGMTGAMVVQGVGAMEYKSFSVDDSSWPPRFWKFHCEFEGGVKLAFVDSRRFGKVWVQDDPPAQAPINKLGFDPLLDMPDLQLFTALLGRRRGAIKGILLDQAFSAGVGNWVADEVLYQARVHPEARAEELSEVQVAAVHAAVRDVIKIACDCNAASEGFPPGWIFHARWTGKKASKTAAGESISFITVGGRTSAFVPGLQKKGAGGEAGEKGAGKAGKAGGKRGEGAGGKAAGQAEKEGYPTPSKAKKGENGEGKKSADKRGPPPSPPPARPTRRSRRSG